MSVVTAMAPPDVAARWSRYELQQFVNVAKVRRLQRISCGLRSRTHLTPHCPPLQNMSWCPNPSCGNAFVALGPVNSAQCTCGTRFCFRCSGEAHEPCRCALVDKWKQKCGNDSETANWILSNTKKCPLCSVRIEKNQARPWCGATNRLLHHSTLPPAPPRRCVSRGWSAYHRHSTPEVLGPKPSPSGIQACLGDAHQPRGDCLGLGSHPWELTLPSFFPPSPGSRIPPVGADAAVFLPPLTRRPLPA